MCTLTLAHGPCVSLNWVAIQRVPLRMASSAHESSALP